MLRVSPWKQPQKPRNEVVMNSKAWIRQTPQNWAENNGEFGSSEKFKGWTKKKPSILFGETLDMFQSPSTTSQIAPENGNKY